jgi:20S proteasome alpha/beta subunit
MSTVVGIVTPDRIVIAADRRAYASDAISEPLTKLWRCPSLAVGIAGDLQDLDIFTGLLAKEGNCDLTWLRSVITDFRNTLEKIGRLRPNTAENGPCRAMSHFLIGTPWGLFHVETEFGLRQVRTFWAIGSGRDHALGVLGYLAIPPSLLPDCPEKAACAAVEVAARFDPWTGDGTDIEVVYLKQEVNNGAASVGQR